MCVYLHLFVVFIVIMVFVKQLDSDVNSDLSWDLHVITPSEQYAEWLFYINKKVRGGETSGLQRTGFNDYVCFCSSVVEGM